MNKTNHSIGCTVNSCSHHAQSQNYCTLPEIKVGSTGANPANSCAATECDSFAPCKNGICQ